MALAEYREIWGKKVGGSAVAKSLGLSLDRVEKESAAAYELLCWFDLGPDLDATSGEFTDS